MSQILEVLRFFQKCITFPFAKEKKTTKTNAKEFKIGLWFDKNLTAAKYEINIRHTVYPVVQCSWENPKI